MYLSDEVLEAVKQDPVEGLVNVIDLKDDFLRGYEGEGWSPEEYDYLFECMSLVISVMRTFPDFFIAVELPELIDKLDDDCSSMSFYLDAVRSELEVKLRTNKQERMVDHFSTVLGKGFVYEFSGGDLERVQVLVNEIRDRISNLDSIKEEHKQRLLRRLERLQSELHKRMSDLDRFWGFLGDAGVVLGKFGEDAKPIIDRAREILQIVWRTQARAEELPSGTPAPFISGESSDHD